MARKQQTRPVIIFDFDGTLVDTFGIALQVFCELMHRQIDDEDISRLRGMNARQLGKELHIHFWQVPFLTWQIRRKLTAHLASIELVPGMDAAVRRLSRTHHLFVLSSNSASNVRQVLSRLKIAGQFVGIYGSAGILHKERSLRRLMRQNQLRSNGVWYIGDETRDIEAAHRSGLHAMAVSWGFNNIAALERHHPDVLVFTPEELAAHFA